MKRLTKNIVLVALFCFLGYVAFKKNVCGLFSKNITIVDYDKNIDREDSIRIFYDNWYWMAIGFDRSNYSFEYRIDNFLTSEDIKTAKPMIVKVARIKGKTAGLVAYFTPEPGVGQVLLLCTDKQYRRRGIGKVLLQVAMEELIKSNHKILYLVTRQDNVQAQALYKQLGFVLSENQEDDKTAHFVYHVS